MSSRSLRFGTWRGTYSPIAPAGLSTLNVSSISSSSIVLRSTTQCRPLTGFAYGLEPGAERIPGVGPADAAAGVLLGDEEAAVAPDVEQHLVHVGDPALGQHLDQARLGAQRLVALVPLVGREVGLDALQHLPRGGGVRGEVDDGAVGRAAVAVPADDDRLALGDSAPFSGSLSSIDAKRQRSLTPWSRRRIAAAWRNSSAVSGSSGWLTPGKLRGSASPRVSSSSVIVSGGSRRITLPCRPQASRSRPSARAFATAAPTTSGAGVLVSRSRTISSASIDPRPRTSPIVSTRVAMSSSARAQLGRRAPRTARAWPAPGRARRWPPRRRPGCRRTCRRARPGRRRP